MAGERSNFAQTCNLFSQYLKEKRTQYLQGDPTTFSPPATMNLLNTMESGPPAAISDQPRSAPMTIFYGGKVIVFSDLSPEKAREIMSFATKGSGPVCSSESSIAAVKPQQRQAAPVGVSGASYLPIMRASSLHKFLAKRKERVVAVAPYQVNNERAASPKAEEQARGQCSSRQLELRL